MKKRFLTLGIVTAIVATLFGLSGCTSDYHYDHADKYTAGGAELTKTVTELDVEWLAGSVTVVGGEGETLSFSEASKETLDERTSLYYWLDGTTLRIKYAQSQKEWGWSDNDYPSKDLTVTLPATALQKLEVATVSANVTLEGVQSNETEIETVSGKIEGALHGTVRELSVDAVSGNVFLECTTAPQEASFNSVSGNITLTIPEDSQFTAEIETVSGAVACDFETTQTGKDYVCGNGENQYEMETVSGNVKLAKAAASAN